MSSHLVTVSYEGKTHTRLFGAPELAFLRKQADRYCMTFSQYIRENFVPRDVVLDTGEKATRMGFVIPEDTALRLEKEARERGVPKDELLADVLEQYFYMAPFVITKQDPSNN